MDRDPLDDDAVFVVCHVVSVLLLPLNRNVLRCILPGPKQPLLKMPGFYTCMPKDAQLLHRL